LNIIDEPNIDTISKSFAFFNLAKIASRLNKRSDTFSYIDSAINMYKQPRYIIWKASRLFYWGDRKEALKIADQIELSFNLCAEDPYNPMSFTLVEFANLGCVSKESQIKYFLHVYHHLKKGNPRAFIKSLIGLGNLKYCDEFHTAPQNWYLEALDVLKNYEDDPLKAQVYIGLGNIKYSYEQIAKLGE
jgi:hypothetical protein